MSQYVKLAEAYKMARSQGKEELARKAMEGMRDMRAKGEVTEDEMIAAAYI
jgi:cytochrome c5